jgi:hypothetical protein
MYIVVPSQITFNFFSLPTAIFSGTTAFLTTSPYDGFMDGTFVGAADDMDGLLVGIKEGSIVGCFVGIIDGSFVGDMEGEVVG